jgi:hypothetical protein
VENAIKFIKRTMKKCKQSNMDIGLALLQIRATPLSTDLPSPAQMMFNRRFKCLIPSLDRLAEHRSQNEDNREELLNRQCVMKANHDKKLSNHSEPELLPVGTEVRVQREDNGPWTHGTVIDHGDPNHHFRSYKVQLTLGGRIIVRNARHVERTDVPAWKFKLDFESHKKEGKGESTTPNAQICEPYVRSPILVTPPETARITENPKPAAEAVPCSPSKELNANAESMGETTGPEPAKQVQPVRRSGRSRNQRKRLIEQCSCSRCIRHHS